jgi:translation initiation factor IF-1
MVKNEAGGCKGKKVARKHTTKGKNELRLSSSTDEKYAIVKKVLGNTCDVICDDGKERRCIIRGKFTGRNKRDNMLDNGTYILVGLREWNIEDKAGGMGGGGGGGNNKGIRYCDLLEVYNSMERDILRRTHSVFSTLKDESGNKYDEADSSIMFVDDNTLKYQNMIKQMEKKSGGGGGGGGGSAGSGESGESSHSDESDDCKEQTIVITTSVKHVGKGVIEQSFDISEDDDDDDVDAADEDYSEGSDAKATSNQVADIKYKVQLETSVSYHKKKVAYHQESEINVNDI